MENSGGGLSLGTSGEHVAVRRVSSNALERLRDSNSSLKSPSARDSLAGDSESSDKSSNFTTEQEETRKLRAGEMNDVKLVKAPIGKRLILNVTKVADLPKPFRKTCMDSGINESLLEKHWQITLNILHFLEKDKDKIYSDSPDKKRFPGFPIENRALKRLLPEKDLSPGEAKKLYKKFQKSGKGGFAKVFRAKEVNGGKLVAVKKMKHASKPEMLANYAEVKHLQLCQHPNVVEYKACHEHKNEFWIVTELLEGGTLSDARDLYRFEEAEIAYIARELLKALEHIHSKGLIHRDLKSSNIMMSVKGEVKLIDFGLCTYLDGSKPTLVGSPHWVPPEMVKRNWYGYSADIWSFGVSLLELANQRSPTSVSRFYAMFMSATRGIPEPFADGSRYTKNFHQFIELCLKVNPTERPSASELLKHPFIQQSKMLDRSDMERILSRVFVAKALNIY